MQEMQWKIHSIIGLGTGQKQFGGHNIRYRSTRKSNSCPFRGKKSVLPLFADKTVTPLLERPELMGAGGGICWRKVLYKRVDS